MGARKTAPKNPITVKSSRGISRHLSAERLIIGGTVLSSLLIVAIIVITQPPWLNSNVANKSQPVLIQGKAHIKAGTSHPPYNSNPPTSGWHDGGSTADWGSHLTVIPDVTMIHNLEHGGIWISYRDAEDAQTVIALEAIVSRYPTHVVLTHRPSNDSRIAVAAWGQLLKLDSADDAQIYNFIARYRFKGPENV
jgi:hypothetical protein